MTGWRVRGKNGAAEILGLKPSTLESRMAKLGIRRRDRQAHEISGFPPIFRGSRQPSTRHSSFEPVFISLLRLDGIRLFPRTMARRGAECAKDQPWSKSS